MLRWKARRGMKELDVLFEAFFLAQAAPLAANGWPQLEWVLTQEDDVLFDWISGRDLPSDPDVLHLIDTLVHA
jgi:succinate dehydrogenase flavin-adding protein (antitoxin of CptAB toxin-antitoxin module)